MAILPILKYPHPLLLVKGDEIIDFDFKIHSIINDMVETMYSAPGIGLAAPQIGKSLRIFVLDVDYELEESEEFLPPKYINKNPQIFINPIILSRSGSKISEEGCLSFPKIYTNVVRATKIDVQYQDQFGNIKKETHKNNLLTICIQHELDHLNGILMTEHVDEIERKKIIAAIK